MLKLLLSLLITGLCLNSYATDFKITHQFAMKNSGSVYRQLSDRELSQFSKRDRIYADTTKLLQQNIHQSVALNTLDNLWSLSGNEVVIQMMPLVTVRTDKIALRSSEKETVLGESFSAFYLLLWHCPESAKEERDRIPESCEIQSSVLVYRDRSELYEHGQILPMVGDSFAPGHELSIYYKYFRPTEMANAAITQLLKAKSGQAK